MLSEEDDEALPYAYDVAASFAGSLSTTASKSPPVSRRTLSGSQQRPRQLARRPQPPTPAPEDLAAKFDAHDMMAYYGDPADGCLKEETAVQVQGLGGDFCTPPCTGPLKSTCPTDVPKGVTAAPECALQDQGSGQGYCALVCIPGGHSGANQCGKATCKNVQLGIGICTYDD